MGALLTAFLVPQVTSWAAHWETPTRVAPASCLVAPMGLAMGTMYPSGVQLLKRDGVTELVPWVWAINGVAGVFASTFGMLVAISQDYTAVVLLGALAYGMTIAAAARGFRVRSRQTAA